MSVRRYVPDSALVVKEHVDPDTQRATEILMEDQSRTVVFESLTGGKAVGNLFSTREKIAEAMGIAPGDITDVLSRALDCPAAVEEVKDPAFRQVSDKRDLTELPICKYYPGDGGRYVASGVIVAEYGGKRNVSFHRMMIMDGKRIAVRLVPRHLFTMHKDAKAKGEDLNVAICIGLPPEVMLAAATSTAYETDEMEIASAMHKMSTGSPLRVGRTDNGLLVPADADYVIEGRITSEMEDEGPFVDITGSYDSVRSQPVIVADKIWTCEDPLMTLLIPGGNEHFLFMGLPREPMIHRSVKQVVPKPHCVRLTEGGCCWLNGVVSVTKNKEGDAVNAIMAAFSGHPSMKQVIIVDEDINIFDDREVEWAVATRFQANRMVRIEGAAGSSLDPSSDGTTWKVGIDATQPLNADMKMFAKAKY